jgi:hypothetical protein
MREGNEDRRAKGHSRGATSWIVPPLLGCLLSYHMLARCVWACDCILIGGLGRSNSDESLSTRFDRAEGVSRQCITIVTPSAARRSASVDRGKRRASRPSFQNCRSLRRIWVARVLPLLVGGACSPTRSRKKKAMMTSSTSTLSLGLERGDWQCKLRPGRWVFGAVAVAEAGEG